MPQKNVSKLFFFFGGGGGRNLGKKVQITSEPSGTGATIFTSIEHILEKKKKTPNGKNLTLKICHFGSI